jgi:GNAT superfamily N-acetyltransferase
VIRQINIDELDALEETAREFYAASRALGSAFRIDHFRELWTTLLSNGAGVIFADFQEEGEIVGTIGGIVHREIYGEALIAEEFFWFVRAGSRGAGVRLYREFEQWARTRGATSLQMCHLFDSMPEKVAKFYLRSGFEPVEMRYAKALTASGEKGPRAA